MKKLFSAITVLMSIFLSSKSYCQINAAPDSVYITRLMSDLNIDATLAVKISEAMRINKVQLVALIKDQNLKPVEKQKQFLLLTREREEKVNSLLNPEQRERLSQSVLKYISKRHFMRRDSLLLLKERENRNQELKGKNSIDEGLGLNKN